MNRRRWRVLEVLDDGGLRVALERPAGSAEPWRGQLLSGAYVARQVELGYARTVHGGQGLTVDTGHALVPIGGTDRQALYTAMSRGRAENHVYVETELRNDAGEAVRVEQPLAVLARSLERDVEQRSATEIREAELAAADSVAQLGPVWADLAGRGAAGPAFGDVLQQVLPAAAADPAALRPGAARAARRGVGAGTCRARRGDAASPRRGRAGLHRRRLRGAGAALAARGQPRPAPRRRRLARLGHPHPGAAAVRRDGSRGKPPLCSTRGLPSSARSPASSIRHGAARLGPIPDDAAARLVWQERAGVVAAWREYAGVPDDGSDSDRPRAGRGAADAADALARRTPGPGRP